MSLTRKKERNVKPAKKYIKFGGETGKFSYYEKYSLDDPRYKKDGPKGENVEIDIDGAIVLDSDLFSVGGYDGKMDKYFWSNEVRSVDDELIVRHFGDKRIAYKGKWADIKEENDDLKYTKSIYLFLNGEIVHLALSGASLTSWFNDIEANENKLGANVIKVAEIKDGKKGRVEYKYCIFEFGEEFDDENAFKADEELQAYLDKYLESGGGQAQVDHAEDSSDDKDEVADTKNWRDVKCKGEDLGNMTVSKLKTVEVELSETGNTDTELYANVCQGIKEYQEAQKTWRNIADSKGKDLKDYAYTEAQDAFTKIMKSAPKHPARLHVEACLEHLEAELDDDIPF